MAKRICRASRVSKADRAILDDLLERNTPKAIADLASRHVRSRRPEANQKRDPLKGRLMRLLDKTSSAKGLSLSAWWGGDTAGERRVRDDAESGRLDWLHAHKWAQRGLNALKDGNRNTAHVYAWSATDAYAAALEARLRPSDWTALGRPSQRRGRPKK